MFNISSLRMMSHVGLSWCPCNDHLHLLNKLRRHNKLNITHLFPELFNRGIYTSYVLTTADPNAFFLIWFYN